MTRPMEGNPGQSWIEDSGFQYLSVELGFWIPIVTGIPDSFRCILDSVNLRIVDSIIKIFPDSRFHKQTFPRFQNPLCGAIRHFVASTHHPHQWTVEQVTRLGIITLLQLNSSEGHTVIRKARPMIGLTRRNFSACSRGTNTDWFLNTLKYWSLSRLIQSLFSR